MTRQVRIDLSRAQAYLKSRNRSNIVINLSFDQNKVIPVTLTRKGYISFDTDDERLAAVIEEWFSENLGSSCREGEVILGLVLYLSNESGAHILIAPDKEGVLPLAHSLAVGQLVPVCIERLGHEHAPAILSLAAAEAKM